MSQGSDPMTVRGAAGRGRMGHRVGPPKARPWGGAYAKGLCTRLLGG